MEQEERLEKQMRASWLISLVCATLLSISMVVDIKNEKEKEFEDGVEIQPECERESRDDEQGE